MCDEDGDEAIAEVKSDGTSAVSYQYDVYGNITNQSGSLYDERQFAGEQADPTGLTYLRARFYDSTTGRFLSRDPRDGWSYSYAGGNPASNGDPSGLDLERVSAGDEQAVHVALADTAGSDLGGTLGRIGAEQSVLPALSDSAGGGLVLGMEAPDAMSADAQQAASLMAIGVAAAPEQAQSGSPEAAGAAGGSSTNTTASYSGVDRPAPDSGHCEGYIGTPLGGPLFSSSLAISVDFAWDGQSVSVTGHSHQLDLGPLVSGGILVDAVGYSSDMSYGEVDVSVQALPYFLKIWIGVHADGTCDVHPSEQFF